MTEVFAGLPEQDVLLAEFFLEKFLRRQTRAGDPTSDWCRLTVPVAATTQALREPVPEWSLC